MSDKEIDDKPVDNNEISLLQFPVDFPIKIMGRTEPGFVQEMVALVQQFAPDFDPATSQMRPSKGGAYISLTVTIHATSQQQLDDIYRAVSAHPKVVMAL